MAGPFRIEGKAYTMAAKSRPVETTSPLVAVADKPVKTINVTAIVIIGIIIIMAVAAAGMAIYKKKQQSN